MGIFLNRLIEEKHFYKRLIVLTLPIVLQSLITSSLNMLDTLMIGSIGEIELAAVGVANQYYFLYSLVIMGVGAGCAILIAQLWGKKDFDNIKVVLKLGVYIGTVLSILFTIVGYFFSENIIAIFNSDTQVIAVGSQYLKVTVFSYFVTALSYVYSAALRSIGNTVLPMWASVIALLTNAALNAILIFGFFGAPALGALGAAYGTLCARMVECLIILIVVMLKVNPLKVNLFERFEVSKTIAKTLYLTSMPVILNEICWGLANVTYNIIYGRIGVEAIATTQITSTVSNLFMIMAFGLAHSSVVVVGNEVGASNEEEAISSAKKIMKLSVLVGIIIGIGLIFISPAVVNLYGVSEAVKNDAITILAIFAGFMVFRVYNAVLIVGIFRGGGDAKYGSIMQGITLWTVGIPLAWMGAFVFHLPVTSVFFLGCLEEVLKFVILRRRFNSNKWINNVVDNLA
ncbi:MAG TPA: MATE family efflux transporter [Firmicutes bacterium]|nr:MATE family efflux transporter [Bacillota bacterium]